MLYAINVKKKRVGQCRAHDPATCRFHSMHFKTKDEAIKALEKMNRTGRKRTTLSKKSRAKSMTNGNGRGRTVRKVSIDGIKPRNMTRLDEWTMVVENFRYADFDLLDKYDRKLEADRRAVRKAEQKLSKQTMAKFRKDLPKAADEMEADIQAERKTLQGLRAKGTYDDLSSLVGRRFNLEDLDDHSQAYQSLRRQGYPLEDDVIGYEFTINDIRSDNDRTRLSITNASGEQEDFDVPAGIINAGAVNDRRADNLDKAKPIISEIRSKADDEDLTAFSTVLRCQDVMRLTGGRGGKAVVEVLAPETINGINGSNADIRRKRHKLGVEARGNADMRNQHIKSGEDVARLAALAEMRKVSRTRGEALKRTMTAPANHVSKDYQVVGVNASSSRFLISYPARPSNHPGSMYRVVDSKGRTVRNIIDDDKGGRFGYYLKWKTPEGQSPAHSMLY